MKKFLFVAMSVFVLTGCAALDSRLADMSIAQVEMKCRQVTEQTNRSHMFDQCMSDTLAQRDLALIVRGRQPESQAYYAELDESARAQEIKERKEREEAEKREKEMRIAVEKKNKTAMCLKMADVIYRTQMRNAIDASDYQAIRKLNSQEYKDRVFGRCFQK